MAGAQAGLRESPRLITVDDFPRAGWGPSGEERAPWYCRLLEEGFVLYFKALPFPFPHEHRRFLLSLEQSGACRSRDIIYRPERDRIAGPAAAAGGDRLRSVLRDFSRHAARFVRAFLTPYASGLAIHGASFRPFEQQGRHRPEGPSARLHVDSLARPTRGSGILRVFTNLHPERARVWFTGEPFDAIAPLYADTAGLARCAARPPWARLLRRRPPYDDFMARFGSWLASSDAFQRDARRTRLDFAPGSAWLCFTDRIPHAVVAGQYAVEQTFLVSPECWLEPDRAPLRVLEALAGVRLCAR